MRAAAFLLSLALWSAAGYAQAQDAAPDTQAEAPPPPVEHTPLPARLSDVEGSVRLLQLPASSTSAVPNTINGSRLPPPPPPDEPQSQAAINMPVLAGMQVETGEDGRAELEFSDGSLARLTPNSSLIVTGLQAGGEQLRAVRGLSYYELPDSSTGAVIVQAGPDQVRLARGSLLRVDLDNSPFQVAVVRGSAHFNSPGSDIGFEALAGETATLDPAAPSAYDLRQDLADNSWDAWNMDRDAALAEMAQNQTNARVGDGTADAPAWNDLDYYGTWYNVPGAGMAWAPDGVDSSFDPYGAGSWGYYSGVGFSWVSAYPWGWLPYHCGGWSWFPGFGWMWQPGSGGYGGVGWYPYTGVHHGPQHYRMPAFPPGTHAPAAAQPVPVRRSTPLQRGPDYRFRQAGATRPEPRVFALKNTASNDDAPAHASTLPVFTAQQPLGYRREPYAFNGGGAAGSSQAYRGTGTPGVNVVVPSQRVMSAPRGAIAPSPRVVAPTPRIAPPPSIVPSAPHFAAPAPAPAARGH